MDLRYYFVVSRASLRERLGRLLTPWASSRRWVRCTDEENGVAVFSYPADDPTAPELVLPGAAWLMLVALAVARLVAADAPARLVIVPIYSLVSYELVLVLILKPLSMIFMRHIYFMDLLAYTGTGAVWTLLAHLLTFSMATRPAFVVWVWAMLSAALFVFRSVRASMWDGVPRASGCPCLLSPEDIFPLLAGLSQLVMVPLLTPEWLAPTCLP